MVRVFSRLRYCVLAALTAIGILASITLAWNYRLMLAYMYDPDISFPRACIASLTLFGKFMASLLVSDFGYAPVSAVLVGIYVALLTAEMRSRRSLPAKGTLSGIVGIVVGILGTGCAACGTLVFTSLFSGATSIVLIAGPLGSRVLPWFGILFLLTAIYLLQKAINKPPVCNI